MYVCMYVGSG